MTFDPNDYPKYFAIGTAVIKVELLTGPSGLYESQDIDGWERLMRTEAVPTTEAAFLADQQAIADRVVADEAAAAQAAADKQSAVDKLAKNCKLTNAELAQLGLPESDEAEGDG